MALSLFLIFTVLRWNTTLRSVYANPRLPLPSPATPLSLSLSPSSSSSLFSILKCSFPESRNFGLPFPNIDAASGDCKMSANKIIRLLERGNSSLEIKGKQKMWFSRLAMLEDNPTLLRRYEPFPALRVDAAFVVRNRNVKASYLEKISF